MKAHTTRTVLLAALLAVAMTGCREDGHDHEHGDGSGIGPSMQGGASTEALPNGLILTEQPADAKELTAALDAASDGDEVTVRGEIGGRVDPFVAGRAVMILVDLSVPDCNAKGDDHCATPWDYCCEPKENLARNSATVQVSNAEGKVLKADLKGAGGIAPGARVVVQGKLAKNGPARTIHATGIYVMPNTQS